MLFLEILLLSSYERLLRSIDIVLIIKWKYRILTDPGMLYLGDFFPFENNVNMDCTWFLCYFEAVRKFYRRFILKLLAGMIRVGTCSCLHISCALMDLGSNKMQSGVFLGNRCRKYLRWAMLILVPSLLIFFLLLHRKRRVKLGWLELVHLLWTSC
jgi:hypothetical protein